MTADRAHFGPARWLVAAIYCGAAAVFIVDMSYVHTLPIGIFYAPMVATAIFRRAHRGVWMLTAIACAMIFVGSFSPSLDPDTFDLAVNRAVSIAAVLGTATLVHYMRNREELCDCSPPLSVIWERSGDAYHASMIDLSGDVRFLLAAERAGQVWCWMAWRPDKALTPRHGQAPTVQQAMQDAEQAAKSP
jgi:hypothetical protein